MAKAALCFTLGLDQVMLPHTSPALSGQLSASYHSLERAGRQEVERRQAAEQEVTRLLAEGAAQQGEIARLQVELKRSQEAGAAMKVAATAAMKAADASHF